MIELSHLTFSYGKNKPNILTDVSLVAEDGKCTVLCGENGAGKSTLVGLLAGILRPMPKVDSTNRYRTLIRHY